MKKPIKLVVVLVLGVVCLGAFLTAYMHNVPKTISEEDMVYIHKIVQEQGYDWGDLLAHDDFIAEIEDIRAIQKAVLILTATQKQVPNNRTRDPKDLYELRYAQCSDRSRVIDKMLRAAGFKTRVASLYITANTGSAIQAILSNNKDLVRSHAMVEVLTSRGWMMVDTNDAWVGLDQDMQPVSLEEWYIKVEQGNPDIWHASNQGRIYWLLEDSFTFVYGLYARHGYFYPPYNAIPDVNWAELRYNIVGK
jgi:hypothetical protein